MHHYYGMFTGGAVCGYQMDFSPSSDGTFYDSPEGTEGRTEVARENNPADIVMIDGTANADNKIISLTGASNTSKIYATQATKTNYSAFSRGAAAGDINAGASGAVDDYCLKVVDAATNASGTARIDFPKTYGGTGDGYHKYRFEMDWKWYTLTGTAPSTSHGSPTGATIVTFYIGGMRVCLNSKSANESTDARGGGALYFQGYQATTLDSAFGLVASGQTTAAGETDKVTKSAAALTADESGKWVHITIDFDFKKGTIDLLIEGETETRRISTSIGSGTANFAQGISGVGISASTGGDCRVNFADNVTLSPIDSPLVSLSAGETLGDGVYQMDFSPSSDGKFYDSPEGTEGRMEVPREDNPAGILLTNRDENVDNKIISSTGNASKLLPSGAAATSYVAFSNNGASGAANDYSLKIAGAFNYTKHSATLTLPKAYGGEGDSYKKYRFEADWQYAYYTTASGLTDYILVNDIPIIRFYFGDKYIGFQTKTADRPNECRGDYALSIYDGGNNSGSSPFGFYYSNTDTSQADEEKVTMSAKSLSGANSGKWIHITVDFDFSAGTIYATFESDIEKREISATISGNEDIFKQGVSKLYFCGSKKSVALINFYDNISITPIMTKEPTVIAESNTIMWKAISGVDSYNVFYGSTADEASASTTPLTGMELDTTTKPGYVIATLDNIAVNVPHYYTVTAVSDNKGESMKSNVVEIVITENIVSDIMYEITDTGSSQVTVKATVDIDAGEGFANDMRLIAAAYDGDMLINVNLSDPVSLSKGSKEEIEVSLGGLPAVSTHGMKMKFFLWDVNMSPIKKLEVQEWGQLID